jgi:proteasome accessory factor C
VFEPDADDPRVVLDLAPEAAWVVDAHPMEAVEERADGSRRVTMAVAADAWFERLLVNLGPHAVVVDAPPTLSSAGQRAAARILARYG